MFNLGLGKYRTIIILIGLFLVFDVGVLGLTFVISNQIASDAVSLNLAGEQRTLVQQCLSNLFDNAVKFVTPGQRPRIVVRCELRSVEAPAAGASGMAAFNPAVRPAPAATPSSFPVAPPPTTPAGRIRIWVEDNGTGIPPAAHEKLFGIFERLVGHDHIEGTGIGLAIVARAMQQMGGACGVESALGHGSRFWLEFAPGVSGGGGVGGLALPR